MQAKVVGTTFRFEEQGPVHFDDFAGKVKLKGTSDVPTKIGLAVLYPEPDNKYDPNAVRVIAKMKDGSTYFLGYLPKGSSACLSVKEPILAKLFIYGYSSLGGYSDSFAVEW